MPDPQTRTRKACPLGLLAYSVISGCVIVSLVTLGGRWLLAGMPSPWPGLIEVGVGLVLVYVAGYAAVVFMQRRGGRQ